MLLDKNNFFLECDSIINDADNADFTIYSAFFQQGLEVVLHRGRKGF